MKKIIIGVLALVALVAGGIFIFAQKRGGVERGFGRHPFPPAFMLGRMADELGLSEEQRNQVKQILETSRTTIQPLMENLRENHQQLEKLGTDGSFNEAQVAELAAKQAETTKQMIVEKEKTKSAIFAVLTPEQRTKAGEMREQFKGKMRGKFGKGGFGGDDGEFPKEF